MNQPAEIDLQPELHLFLVEWAQQYPEIEQIILFGSRALGNAKRGSDVDLAVVGTQVTQSLHLPPSSAASQVSLVKTLLEKLPPHRK